MSAEPDGEGCKCPDALSEARIECDICIPAPAQDGAEVEALTIAAILEQHTYVIDGPPAGVGVRCACGFRQYDEHMTPEAADLAARMHVAALLAQRDKDRDAAVAAKVLERAVQAERQRDEWHQRYDIAALEARTVAERIAQAIEAEAAKGAHAYDEPMFLDAASIARQVGGGQA